MVEDNINSDFRETGRSRGRSVSIATRLRTGRSAFDSRQGLGFFYPRHHVHTSSGTLSSSYPMGIRDSFRGSKAIGA